MHENHNFMNTWCFRTKRNKTIKIERRRIHKDMPTITHFDNPVDNPDRAQTFYEKVFGWNMKKVTNPVTGAELWMCQTEDEFGNKGITGGMMRRQSLPSVTNYISVSSIQDYLTKIEQAGGKITVPKTEIQNVGSFALFLDSENNLFGLFEEGKGH